jgi:hypothetical protein
MRREYRVLDVEIENGELKVVIEATSLSESNLGKYNPKYPLSPEQLKKYGIRWDGKESSLKNIKRKIKGRFLEL